MGTWSRQAGLFGAVLLAHLGGLSQASAATATQAAPNPPIAGTYYETPQSLNCIYQLVQTVAGCNPNNTALPQNTTLGGHAIVILTNYHDANLTTELATYSTQFGLPTPNLSIFHNTSALTCNQLLGNSDLNNIITDSDNNYALKCYQYGIDLLEVAHAMAPAAKLVLVEMPYTNSAASYTTITPSTLAAGIDAANTQAVAAGGGEVVIAVSDTESSSYTSVESHLTGQNVLYFSASSGAPFFKGTLGYPGTSPNVVSVSSSNIARDMENPMNTGNFLSERTGPSGEGGLSSVFAAPAYQNRISARTGNANKRAVPDIVAASNGNANIWVFNRSNSTVSGWFAASGPYISAAIAAGIANAADASNSFTSTANLLTSLYGKFNTSSLFDVGIGICGAYDGAFATVADRNSVLNQWDFCTGVGAPRGIAGFRP